MLEKIRGIEYLLSKFAHKTLLTHFGTYPSETLPAYPGNRLEALNADRAGQHSIRINDQFRICFTSTAEGPTAVEITDYH